MLSSDRARMSELHVTGGPGYDPRFRIPVLPIVCIFAAAGLLRKKTAAP